MQMLSDTKRKLDEILHQTGEYFKIDMSYLVKGGAWVTAGQVISSVAAFILSIFYANFLLPETYGVYRYVMSILAVLTVSSLSGMPGAVTQSVARDFEGSVTTALRVRIKWGIFGALAAFGIALYYFSNANTELGISFLIVAGFIPFMDSLNIYDALLIGRKKFDRSSQYQIINQLIATCMAAAAIYFTRNLYVILFAYVFSWTMLRAISYLRVIRIYKPNTNFDPSTIRFGKDLSFINILGTVADYLDKILIFHFIGVVPLAVYTIATAPVEQIKSLLSRNITKLALPKYAEKSTEEVKAHVYKWILRISLGLVVITAMYAFAVPFLFDIFFRAYSGAIVYSQLFSLTIISTLVFLPLTALNAKVARKQLYSYEIISSIVQIGLLAALVSSTGLLGIILARILSSLFNVVLATLLLRKI